MGGEGRGGGGGAQPGGRRPHGNLGQTPPVCREQWGHTCHADVCASRHAGSSPAHLHAVEARARDVGDPGVLVHHKAVAAGGGTGRQGPRERPRWGAALQARRRDQALFPLPPPSPSACGCCAVALSCGCCARPSNPLPEPPGAVCALQGHTAAPPRHPVPHTHPLDCCVSRSLIRSNDLMAPKEPSSSRHCSSVR